MLWVVFGSGGSSLPGRAAFTAPIPPIDLLLFREYRFDALYELKVSSIVVQSSIGAGPVQIKPSLPFHTFGGSAICDPRLAVAGNPLPSLRQGHQRAQRSS